METPHSPGPLSLLLSYNLFPLSIPSLPVTSLPVSCYHSGEVRGTEPPQATCQTHAADSLCTDYPPMTRADLSLVLRSTLPYKSTTPIDSPFCLLQGPVSFSIESFPLKQNCFFFFFRTPSDLCRKVFLVYSMAK